MSQFDVDLFVIGAGSGGVRAARIAANHGAKVAIAESFRIGGTCVIRGCVPKKLMVYASRFADDFEDAAGFGWQVGPVRFDWPTLVAAKEKEISRLSAIYQTNLDKAGVEILQTRATVTGPHEVRLDNTGKTLRAGKILIATGGTPVIEPKIPGLEYAISSNEIFDLKAFPKRLLIIGSGYIAVEFASLFARLGSEVTLAFRAENVLRNFDTDLQKGLATALQHAGVKIRASLLPNAIHKHGQSLHVAFADGTSADFDQVMVATGRRPVTRGLGLESAGVVLGADGAINVDDFAASSCPSIHAVGDVTNRVNLTPVAIREGHAFADNVFGGGNVRIDYDLIPTAVFTTPEIGTIGLSEAHALAKYKEVDIYHSAFRPMKATLSGRDEKTMMKIIVDAATDRVLGVHIMGHDAGEMVQLLGISMQMGAKKADFDATMAVHPTASEELVTMRSPSHRHRR
ncbi:MAG: glutathione-disulfide reductase [Hyphomicrobiales bacterium]|nr:glutathione-disulfide reductase [Hyphomicrobiales bacterium]MDE2113981.1 glutathione-disulfide reductase [Hyphomicrobiales bacterium]